MKNAPTLPAGGIQGKAGASRTGLRHVFIIEHSRASLGEEHKRSLNAALSLDIEPGEAAEREEPNPETGPGFHVPPS